VKESTSNIRSVLAKLLAKENITVQHGNYETAFFDVENRILGLPIWKDKGKDVYDLLVGHEVGHALYTPMFDVGTVGTGFLKNCANVVEDIRIERMIQSTYPGLIRCFTEAYAVLHADNFFGIAGKDVNTLGLGDRINLKAKLGNRISIQFSKKEQPIVDQCFAVQTWEDTLKAAKALCDFCKKAEEQKKSKPVDKPEPSKNATTQKSESEKTSDDESESEKTSDDESESEKTSDDGAESEAKPSEKEGDDSSTPASSKDIKSSDESNEDKQAAQSDGTPQSSSGQPNGAEEPQMETQRAFSDNSKGLLDTTKETLRTCFVREPTDEECFNGIVPYKMLFAQRDACDLYRQYAKPSTDDKFKEFMASTNKYVGVLKKEFDIRKAAYQYSRSTISRTGVLNVNKLHSYKIDDDIFLSVSQLATAKDHGMVMFIDYSSSMCPSIPHVLRHIITLAMFCKALSIPFQVYGFTSSIRHDVLPIKGSSEGRIRMENLVMPEIINSDMPKSDYARAIRDLFIRSLNYNAAGMSEQMGSTPLNEALIAAHKIVRKFRKDHPVQKVTTIFLTDGEGGPLTSTHDMSIQNRTQESIYGYRDMQMTLNGRKIKFSLNARDTMMVLIDNLKKSTDSKMIGFFIPAGRRPAKYHAAAAASTVRKQYTLENEKAYIKDKSICMPGAFNYDEYFIVSSGNELSLEEEDLDIDSDMSRGRMARAFSDFTKSKRVNRVFVTKFAEAIA